MTVPNMLASGRLVGAPFLIVLALLGQNTPVLVLFLVLEASDWLDGKLAMWLDQRTTIGARLDTVADLAMYGALLVALLILEGELMMAEWPWWTPALVAYGLSWAFSLHKFGKLPSYHTRSAKFSAFLALVSAVALLAAGEAWPLRVTAVVVTLANLEAMLITRKLATPRPDVSSIFTLE
jgi:CDP-diacylglycerol--glycerol-3-phosphate 3-phosphatidyltransferase